MGNSTISTKPARVASYNIRKCIGIDRKRSPERIVDVLNTLDADVIALQEADKRLKPRKSSLPRSLLAEETDLIPVMLHPQGPSIGHHGNAILVRKPGDILRSQSIDLPGLEPRGAVLAELRVNGCPLRVIGVHLALLKRHRRHQAAEIVRINSGLPEMPTIVLGDFNEWDETGGLEPLAQNFNILSPGKSFHTARPVAPLDRIAISKEIRVENVSVNKNKPAHIASDHLPIWADLSLPWACD